jgi:hypothetical protein
MITRMIAFVAPLVGVAFLSGCLTQGGDEPSVGMADQMRDTCRQQAEARFGAESGMTIGSARSSGSGFIVDGTTGTGTAFICHFGGGGGFASIEAP